MAVFFESNSKTASFQVVLIKKKLMIRGSYSRRPVFLATLSINQDISGLLKQNLGTTWMHKVLQI